MSRNNLIDSVGNLRFTIIIPNREHTNKVTHHPREEQRPCIVVEGQRGAGKGITKIHHWRITIDSVTILLWNSDIHGLLPYRCHVQIIDTTHDGKYQEDV